MELHNYFYKLLGLGLCLSTSCADLKYAFVGPETRAKLETQEKTSTTTSSKSEKPTSMSCFYDDDIMVCCLNVCPYESATDCCFVGEIKSRKRTWKIKD